VHAPTAGSADGLAIDAQGNVFVTTSDGVEVFAPDGSRWGAIEVPEQPANCAFGDADHRTLYITARTSLYRVRLANPGEPTL
jgi:gluconolactonase